MVVTGGGSGGHIYPALAIAQALSDFRVVYVGARGHLEERIVPQAGLPFVALSVSGMNRKGHVDQALAGLRALAALGRVMALLRRERPSAVIGTGGYVTGPVGLAAALTGIPLFLLEANVTPGLANRLLLRHAACIFLAYEGTLPLLPPRVAVRARVTGVPVRREILSADRREARQRLHIPPEATVLLVVGGSQGADAVNRAAEAAVAARLPVHVLWATGARYYERWRHLRGEHVDVRPYIEDMPQALAAADFVLARAGSSTLSELTARGLPAVLIPSPNVPDDHQRKNALYLERQGACVVVDEDEVERHLLPALEGLLDGERRRRMAAASAALGRPQALSDIAQAIREEVRARTLRR